MENENTNTETTSEEGTVEEQVKTDKTFTQKDVDTAIANRLSREKLASKKIKEDAENLVTDMNERISSYEEILKGVIEKEKAGVPEQYKKLLEKLPLLEQFEFLSDPKNKVEKVTVPITPKSDGELKTETNKKIPNLI